MTKKIKYNKINVLFNPTIFLLAIPIVIISMLNISQIINIKISKNTLTPPILNEVKGVKDFKTEKMIEESFWMDFLSTNPNYLPGLITLIKIEINLGKYNEAKYYLQKIRDIDPNNIEIKQLEKKLD